RRSASPTSEEKRCARRPVGWDSVSSRSLYEKKLIRPVKWAWPEIYEENDRKKANVSVTFHSVSVDFDVDPGGRVAAHRCLVEPACRFRTSVVGEEFRGGRLRSDHDALNGAPEHVHSAKVNQRRLPVAN